MSRNFNGTSQYLRTTSTGLVSSQVLSIGAWAKTSGTITRALVFVGQAGTSNRNQIQYNGTADRKVNAFTAVGGSSASASSSNTFSDNVWFHGLAVFNGSASRTAYINGSAGTENTTTIATSAPNSWIIGARDNGSIGGYHSGDISEVAVWSAALNADDAAKLAAGYSPLFVRPDALVAYVPLFGRNGASGNEEDWVSGYALTQTNSPTVTDHPRIIYPRRRTIFLPSGAAGATEVNVTGQAITSALGSVTTQSDTDVSVTGQTLTSALGSVTAEASVLANVTGQAITSALGSVTTQSDADVSVTGQAITSALGSVTAESDSIVNAPVTGQAITSALGSVTTQIDTDVSVTGQVVTSALGTVTAEASILASVTGQAITSALGSVTTQSDASVSATGQAVISSLGSVQAGADVTVIVTGLGLTVSVDSVQAFSAALAEISGIQINASLGSVSLQNDEVVQLSGMLLTLTVEQLQFLENILGDDIVRRYVKKAVTEQEAVYVRQIIDEKYIRGAQ